MLRSFIQDWSRWSVSERRAVKLAGLGLVAILATQIGSYLI